MIQSKLLLFCYICKLYTIYDNPKFKYGVCKQKNIPKIHIYFRNKDLIKPVVEAKKMTYDKDK